ncbi:MAG: tetratricopeptide repeat protein [Rikenellaceae bacterium]
MKCIISLLTVALLVSTTVSVSAQKMGERGEVRKGNKSYNSEDYVAAAEHYVGALEQSPTNFEAKFNLGCAVAKIDSLADAAAIFGELAADSLLSDAQRSISYYNLGNAQFGQQQLEEALESYKDAMRFDPSDVDAKYNYAYTKSLLEQQQQDQQDQQQDQDQDNSDDEQQDQQQDQDQQEGDDEQDDQQQDQQPGDDEQQEQPQDQQQEQPQDGEISQQEREQMLDAIQAQEDKTQDDLKERARGVVVQGVKNW